MYGCIHQNDFIDIDIKKHWRSSGVFIVNFKKIPYFFLVFIAEFGEVLPAAFTSRDQSTDK